MNPSPTTEERIWAVISHLSALAFGIGLAIPIVGWSEQRRKSNYASFQCLQALGYQSLGYTVWLLSYLVFIILFSLLIILASVYAETSGTTLSTVSVIWSGLFLFFMFGMIVIYLLLPIIGAVACGFGKDFRYPILGKRLARYLGYGLAGEKENALSLNGEHEERWVASMGHFSVIIALWGMLAPITTWILQGKQNVFLKFQSIQTTVYQGIVNLLFMGAGGVYLLGILMTFIFLGVFGNLGTATPGSTISMIVLFATLLFSALAVLAIPVFHILGQWAGYRMLRGDNYRYPIIGRMVEKRLAKSYGVQEIAPVSSSEPLDSTKEAA
jgi:uncharacterized Tic20 family protein